MKTYGFFSTVLLLIAMAGKTSAQETSPTVTENLTSQQADSEQLRQLRESLTEAVLAGDVEKQIEKVIPDVVTIWQNNQVAVGHDGLREFFSDIGSAGEENIFRGYTERPTSDKVTILPGGNTAIAYGKSVPHYKWLGLDFDLENRWSATLLKLDGQWKLAAYHVSGNIVDNPVLAAAKQMVYWAAGIGLVVGILIGAIGAKLVRKRPQSVAE